MAASRFRWLALLLPGCLCALLSTSAQSAESRFTDQEQAWLLGTLGLALLGYLALWLWNRQLKRELARQRQSLGESESRLLAAEAIAHIGNWEYRVADAGIRWSDELYRIFGMVPQARVVTYDWLISRVHPSDRAAHDAYLGRMLASRPGEPVEPLDYRLLRDDGQERRVHVRVRIEYDASGKAERLFGTVQDITEQRQAEVEARSAHARTRELLAEAEQARRVLQQAVEDERRTRAALERENARTQLILDTTLDGYVLADTSGRLLDVNPAYCQLVGHARDELLGMNIRQLEASMNEAQIRARITAMQNARHARFETRHRHRDGHLLDLDVNVTIMELEGHPLVAAFVRDISERKQAEQDLVRLNEDLERKVAERTGELTAANARLKELDRLKSMFIASMSHELRTPLNAIIGFTGMIIGDMAGPVSDKQRGYLERVYRSGKHLLALITDIIDISKIEAGMLAVEVEDLPLRLAALEAAGEVAADARAKGLEILLNVPADITPRTDHRRLGQCLLNLLSNAVKYTERGHVELQAQVEAGWVEVAVRDTGIGIAPKDMDKLFQPFSRLESDLKILAGGTGLGLYLTRKLAREMLGGEVSASSQLGHGSTFVLRFPLTRAPQ